MGTHGSYIGKNCLRHTKQSDGLVYEMGAKIIS